MCLVCGKGSRGTLGKLIVGGIESAPVFCGITGLVMANTSGGAPCKGML